MAPLGNIEPVPESRSGRADWVALINAHPRLSPFVPIEGINPFTKQPLVFRAPVDVARVMSGDTEIGQMIWAQDGSGHIIIWAKLADQADVESVSVEIAEKLGWQFRRRDAA